MTFFDPEITKEEYLSYPIVICKNSKRYELPFYVTMQKETPPPTQNFTFKEGHVYRYANLEIENEIPGIPRLINNFALLISTDIGIILMPSVFRNDFRIFTTRRYKQ